MDVAGLLEAVLLLLLLPVAAADVAVALVVVVVLLVLDAFVELLLFVVCIGDTVLSVADVIFVVYFVRSALLSELRTT